MFKLHNTPQTGNLDAAEGYYQRAIAAYKQSSELLQLPIGLMLPVLGWLTAYDPHRFDLLQRLGRYKTLLWPFYS